MPFRMKGSNGLRIQYGTTIIVVAQSLPDPCAYRFKSARILMAPKPRVTLSLCVPASMSCRTLHASAVLQVGCWQRGWRLHTPSKCRRTSYRNSAFICLRPRRRRIGWSMSTGPMPYFKRR